MSARGAFFASEGGVVPLLGEALTIYRCNGGVVSRVMFALKQVARRGGKKAMEDARGFQAQLKAIADTHGESKGICRETNAIIEALEPRDA